jgi:endo-1,3(4)-beta-glucanase
MPLRTRSLLLPLALAALAGCGSSAPAPAACPGGSLSCGGACVQPQTDALHCGACGTACAAGHACVGGACSATCTPVALDLDTPLDSAAPPFSSRTGLRVPTALWASTTPPLPTNASWENLVLGSGEMKLDLLPYQLKAEPSWLDVAYVPPSAFANSATEVSVPEVRQIMLGALSFTGATPHAVQSHDLFSVTLRYGVAGASMTAPLVQGMTYVTVDYAGLRPMIIPGTFTIASVTVNGVTSTTPGAVTGTRFKLLLGDGSTWLLYASSAVTFNWTTGNMVAASTFNGTLRVANAPTPADVAVLDAHAGAVPSGGTLDVSIACDVTTLRFSFTTTPGSTGPLLMAALPHHQARLVAPTITTLAYPTLRGTLAAVEGNTWTMSLPLSTIGWTAPRPMAPAHVEAVRTALAGDAGFVPDGRVETDPYFGGKLLAKLARLALIADELGETATAASLRARLAPLEARWLEGTNANPLVYDTTWGGVVTSDGVANPSADFGQGYYNDHHFHYGYHLYAAAALIKGDPTFLTPTRTQALLALARDIANPSPLDPKFPRLRHMDLYRGHSWASGLAENPDGRDQESTSEAVNAWYGLQLLGEAMGRPQLRDLGRVLLALEVDSARRYWQIPAASHTLASTVYQDPFAQNRCVGRLYQTRATFDTFFHTYVGPEAFKVYGIQMLPYTPATEALLSPTWVGDAWPLMQPAADSTSGVWAGWKALLYMAHATTGREAAWTEVFPLTAVEEGNSRTNTLWWVASRP